MGYLLSPMGREADYKTAILDAVSDPESFLRLTLPSAGRHHLEPSHRAHGRGQERPPPPDPRFSRTQDMTENAPLADAGTALDELLALPLSQVHVQTSRQDLHVRITKKGRALFKRARPSRPNVGPALSHNRVKHRCSAEADTPDFVSGTDGRDLDLDGWTAGLGWEKRLQEQISLRLEARYTRYGDQEWTALFQKVGVTVPSVLQAGGIDLSSSLGWSF